MTKAQKWHPAYKLKDKLPDVHIQRIGDLYHVTLAKNVDSILKEGLRASSGLIWFFETPSKSNLLTTALTKNFDDEFAVIRVNKNGCYGFLTREKYSESLSYYFLKQDVIDPQHLELEGQYSININKLK